MKIAKATPPGQPTKHIEMSKVEEEARRDEELKFEKDLALNSYKLERSMEYEKRLDPFTREALAESLLEGDDTKLNELKIIRLAIKEKYPKP